MKACKATTAVWQQGSVSGLVLLTGIFAANALSTSAPASLTRQIVAVVCGLAVGSLTVGTFRQGEGAYTVTAAFYSALTVIACTLTLPLTEYIALLTLCGVTAAVCLVSARSRPAVNRRVTVARSPIRTRDDHR